MSSYFFFSKINAVKDEVKEKQALGKFVKRNLMLYLIWFIFLFPITIEFIKKRCFYDDNITLGILRLIRNFIFSETFLASWFITALVIATVIIFYISKKLNDTALLVISFIVYIVMCLWSGDAFVLNKFSIINTVKSSYENIFSTPCNSFPVALFWITCGKCFADGIFKWSKKINITILILSLALLFIEFRIAVKFQGLEKSVHGADCYFILAPLCISIFHLIVNIKPKYIKQSVWIRKTSTVIFVTHETLIYPIQKLLYSFGITRVAVLFGVTLFICIIISAVILFLENKKGFTWLRYAN